MPQVFSLIYKSFFRNKAASHHIRTWPGSGGKHAKLNGIGGQSQTMPLTTPSGLSMGTTMIVYLEKGTKVHPVREK